MNHRVKNAAENYYEFNSKQNDATMFLKRHYNVLKCDRCDVNMKQMRYAMILIKPWEWELCRL